jgi:hypothetical protein
MNDLDNKIADVEDELLKATSERRKDLLEQYDKLGEQREKHSNEIAPPPEGIFAHCNGASHKKTRAQKDGNDKTLRMRTSTSPSPPQHRQT